MKILDEYVRALPSDQNALDLFKNEWASKLPKEWDNLISGKIPLFEDSRIKWANQISGGIAGKNILELGPLEGGHSYMLEKFGASSIVSIEANKRAFMKCLINKNLLELQRTKYLLGDFVEYLRQTETQFDVCIASGVLYHMVDPLELLELISARCQALLLWTQYYDESVVSNRKDLKKRFSTSKMIKLGNHSYVLHKYNYKEKLKMAGFCGGSSPYSYWLVKSDILEFLRKIGFINVNIGSDNLKHQNGPCMLLYASKTTT